MIVAAKDLPVGTLLSKDELKTAVKTKKVPKDGLPPAFVTDLNDLTDKRLSRAVRMEETFNPADLSKGGPGVFKVPGLLRIVVQRKPATKARMGINPFTKQEVMFKAKPARNVVKVRPLRGLKEMV